MSHDRLTRYVRHFHENGVKKLLEDGHNLREMLLLAGLDFAERIDPERIENRSETFIKQDFRHLAADFVVRAPLLHDDGATTWCWVYVLVEHQSEPDPTMPLRLLEYVVQIFRVQARAWMEKHGNRAPDYEPVVPVLFYTGHRRWDPGVLADFVQPAQLNAYTPLLRPVYFDLHATSGELLARSGWLGPVLRLFDARRAPPAAFRDILADTIRRLEAMPDELRARWLDFLSFTLALVYHDRDPDEHATLEHTIIESVATDVRRKELRTMRRTIADKFRDEGQSIATLETSRAMLLRLLERRFGAITDTIRATIERTDDVDQLNRWFDQVATADDLTEVGIG